MDPGVALIVVATIGALSPVASALLAARKAAQKVDEVKRVLTEHEVKLITEIADLKRQVKSLKRK